MAERGGGALDRKLSARAVGSHHCGERTPSELLFDYVRYHREERTHLVSTDGLEGEGGAVDEGEPGHFSALKASMGSS